VKFQPWTPKVAPENYDFDYVEFRKAILDQGGPIRWDHGVPCPCRNELSVGYSASSAREIDTQEPNTNCPVCEGTGVMLVNSQEIVGMLWQYGENNRFSQYFGRLAPGEAHLTLLPEHIPDMDDRFTMLDRTIVVSDTFRRKGPRAKLRFPVSKKILELGSEMDPAVLEPREVGVIGLWVANQDGTYNSRPPLVENVDFKVVDGEIDWSPGDTLGTAPAEGTPFSIRYYANPVYKVLALARVCRDTKVLVDGYETHGAGPVAVIVTPMYRGFQRTSE
jgi:hypothetical protein